MDMTSDSDTWTARVTRRAQTSSFSLRFYYCYYFSPTSTMPLA